MYVVRSFYKTFYITKCCLLHTLLRVTIVTTDHNFRQKTKKKCNRENQYCCIQAQVANTFLKKSLILDYFFFFGWFSIFNPLCFHILRWAASVVETLVDYMFFLVKSTYFSVSYSTMNISGFKRGHLNNSRLC